MSPDWLWRRVWKLSTIGRRYYLEGYYDLRMGKCGRKPEGKVRIRWSPEFAYAIGLIASDGCLSQNGRHITFTSVEKEQLANFQKALGIHVAVGTFSSGNGRTGMRIQFGDVLFYRFLVSIGLTPAKSKTIGVVSVPEKLFFHFLRGVFDGDGSTYSYWDKRWKSSFMFYTEFVSASAVFINWLQSMICNHTGASGHITGDGTRQIFQLKYAKRESILVLRKMYPSHAVMCLPRKRLKIEQMLGTVGEKL